MGIFLQVDRNLIIDISKVLHRISIIEEKTVHDMQQNGAATTWLRALVDGGLRAHQPAATIAQLTQMLSAVSFVLFKFFYDWKRA